MGGGAIEIYKLATILAAEVAGNKRLPKAHTASTWICTPTLF
jgi:hypothetical protein